MEGNGGQRLRQGTTRQSAESFYYRGEVRTNELVECLVLKELKLTTKEIIRSKAVGLEVTDHDRAPRRRAAELDGRLGFS